MDVSQNGWEKVLDEIKDLNVSVLVNNIGGGNTDGTLRYFHEYSDEHHQNIHNINLFSTQKMLSKILPQMVSQKKGRIINVSSFSIFFAYKMSVYPGDKAFINTLTEQLNTEYEDFNIRLEAILVGEVSTPGLGNKPADGFKTCTPDQISESSLDLWGWAEVYAPFWGHSLLLWSTQNFLPKFVLRLLVKDQYDNIIVNHLAEGKKLVDEIRSKDGL